MQIHNIVYHLHLCSFNAYLDNVYVKQESLKMRQLLDYV